MRPTMYMGMHTIDIINNSYSLTGAIVLYFKHKPLSSSIYLLSRTK